MDWFDYVFLALTFVSILLTIKMITSPKTAMATGFISWLYFYGLLLFSAIISYLTSIWAGSWTRLLFSISFILFCLVGLVQGNNASKRQLQSESHVGQQDR
jgi:hypothetical protein